MPPSPPLRLIRAAVFTVVCVALTLLAHVMASRDPVPWWMVSVGGIAVFGVALVLGGHERSLATICGGLLCGQFGLHVLFAAGQPQLPAHLGHGQTTETTATIGSAAAGSAVGATSANQGGWGMTLTHLAAALVSAWWLRRGERAAWSLARRIAALATFSLTRLLALVSTAPVSGPVRVRPRVLSVAHPVSAVLRHSIVLRGPPFRSRALFRDLSA